MVSKGKIKTSVGEFDKFLTKVGKSLKECSLVVRYTSYRQFAFEQGIGRSSPKGQAHRESLSRSPSNIFAIELDSLPRLHMEALGGSIGASCENNTTIFFVRLPDVIHYCEQKFPDL